MANHRNRFPARRRFLKQSTVLTATMVALPHLARAKGDPAPPADATTADPQNAATTAGDPLRAPAPRRARDPKR
jgi:hypothetical protein